MKWIGQFIYDQIARFRDDIYLEDVSTGTIASGGNLGLDSNNKIVKATSTSHDEVTLAGTPDYITISGQEITRNAIDLTADVTGVLPSANLDSDTSHLSVAQTFTAAKTFGTTNKLQFRDANAYINSPTANDLEISATDILLDAAGPINLDVGAGNIINFQEAGTTIADISAHHSATYLQIYENEGASTDDYFQIKTAAAGATTITTVDAAGTDADLDFAIDGTFSVASTGIDISTGGTITNAVWQGDAIATAYIADDAVTFAKASGVATNVYGNVIKLIPSDFGVNDDGGNTKFGVGYVEASGAGYGMRSPNSNAELFAFVSIPEGMKATHVHIYAKGTYSIEVFEVQIDATTVSSKGSGNCNTNLDITDVNASATNFLAIMVSITATTDKVYGGIVTIAAQ